MYNAGYDAIAVNKLESLVNNLLTSREKLFQQIFDPRRNIDDECGYPPTDTIIDAGKYRALFDRDSIARRVVELMPKESFDSPPLVGEDDDPSISTEFEKAFAVVCAKLRGEQSWLRDENNTVLWEHVKRAVIAARIGHFGILLLGFNDGKLFQEPVEGVVADSPGTQLFGGTGTEAQYTGVQFAPSQQPSSQGSKNKRELMFLRAFDESLVQIVQYEADIHNPRFGMPIMYLVTLNDPREQRSGVGLPLATIRVHWSRVIHIADGKVSSEIFAAPAMQPCLNRILDLYKTYGGSAEAYWRGATPIVSLETHPQLGGDVVVDQRGMQNTMENVMNGLQRYLLLTGMGAKVVAPTPTDPTSYIAVHIEAICIVLGCPIRVFKGSERGELASSQDDSKWNDHVRGYMNSFLTPNVIAPLLDRLIAVGVLPQPKKGYTVKWPDLDSLSDKDKAQIAAQRTTAMSQYVSGNVHQLMSPMDYLTKELGYDEWTAEQICASASEFTDDAEHPLVPDEGQNDDRSGNADEGGSASQDDT